MDLNEIAVFARVVQTGSFTTAAAALGMPKSTVSRKVTALEERLGARLLQRTTRKLSLTDVGQTYYGYCARIVAEVEDAERAVSSLQEAPRGLLRLTAGTNSGWLGPIVGSYLERYPEVQVELSCTGRVADLVEERFDLGIRAGALSDSTLVAKSLGVARWFLVATPGYLKKRGRPKSPDDLKAHDCLLFGTGASGTHLRLESDGREAQITLSPRVLVDDLEILRASASAGVGIAVLPAFQCSEELRARRFERVLHDWDVPSTPIHVVYPTARYVSPKVKAFVDHLQRSMTPPPWERGPSPRGGSGAAPNAPRAAWASRR
jgi:DNA-binding transcriptional LysR family regulator